MVENSHLMELPRKILIGDNVAINLGKFVKSFDYNIENVAIISGNTVIAMIGKKIKKTLRKANINDFWYVKNEASLEEVSKLNEKIRKQNIDLVLGIGGGRSVDLAKMIAFNLKKPFISVPTSASHDGISSPFVSIKGTDKPYSIKASTPIGVLADTRLISDAPKRLISSGCGDLIAKVTAVKDWELARDENKEYFGTYAANLASMSAEIIIKRSKYLLKNKSGFRTIIEALISAGVASCIAGSSRPCSGAEHLFSHAIEYVTKYDHGLHGERVGLGTIIMAKLHGIDWESISETLENVGSPTKAKQLNLREQDIIKALTIAKSLRPERYTILNKTKLDKKTAYDLIKSVKII
ncbi:MAG: NAD(P)-dependent glycerol-1-phosphate dehydrogenase [Nitrososphaeraceae archaeon]